MDGNAWYFTLGFPSTSLVYINLPSRHRACSIHLSSHPFTLSLLHYPAQLQSPTHIPSSLLLVLHCCRSAAAPAAPGFISNSGNSRGCSIRYINLESYMAFLYDSLNRTDRTHLPTFQARHRSSEPEYPSLHTTNPLNPNPHLTFYTRLL
jgi:hypothetical protein